MYNLKGNEFPKMTFLLLLVCFSYFLCGFYTSNEGENQSWSDVLVFDIKRSDFDK